MIFAATIYGDRERQRAFDAVASAPPLARVRIDEPKRSLDQNAALWAKLHDIATQKEYNGLRLSADDWKILFLDALFRETRMVPNLDSTGMVALGRSSSNLSRREFSDLLEIITAWGVSHGVVFGDEQDARQRERELA